MKRLILIALILACAFKPAPVMYGQSTIINAPDCTIPFNFNTNGNAGTISMATTPVATMAYNNTVNACTSWTLTYQATGLTALSIEFDAAPDNNASPGIFTIWTSLVGGTLPLTNVPYGQITGTSFAPWLQVQVDSITGTGQITGVLLGYRNPSGAAIGSSGATLVSPGLNPFNVVTSTFRSVLQLCNAIRTTNCRSSNQ